MELKKYLGIAAALTLLGSGANAAVIGFDDITGGGPNSNHWESNFYFEPAGSTGDTKCWGTKCLKEVTQEVGTSMIYDESDNGEANISGTHSLDFFYFVAIGNTTTDNNSFGVQGLDDQDNVLYEAEFVIETEDFLGFDWQTYTETGTASAFVTFAKDIGSDPEDPDVINYNVGYWVDLEGWVGITTTRWFINSADGPTDGQWRLDCVGANEPNTSGGASGCEPTTPIPVPAAGWLLFAAVGGLALKSRKSQKT